MHRHFRECDLLIYNPVVVLNFCGLDMFCDFAVFSTIRRKKKQKSPQKILLQTFSLPKVPPLGKLCIQTSNNNGYEHYPIKKRENVLISMKQDFPKDAKINTSKKPSPLQNSSIRKKKLLQKFSATPGAPGHTV